MAKKSKKKEDETKKVVAKCDNPNEVVANCDHPDEVIANCDNLRSLVHSGTDPTVHILDNSQIKCTAEPTLLCTIPVFSIEEQSRIVTILDTFEASIRNLEAQQMQRQKQYEYYREKLLTFE